MRRKILEKENMIFGNLDVYLSDYDQIAELDLTFGNAKDFELNPKRPRKVHTFIFRTNALLNMFDKYKDLFQEYPFFKINITQAKVMPYITYVLKDKSLIETPEYKAFKNLYNKKYGAYLEKPIDKTSKSQCYRLKGTITLEELSYDVDVKKWMDDIFKPVMNITL